MAAVNATMAVLVKNSVENATKIRDNSHHYANSAADTSGNPMGGAATDAAAPDEDLRAVRPRDNPLPRPGRGTRI